MKRRRMLFIVNPISGFGLGKELPDRIRRLPEYEGVDYDIVFTAYSGHARKLVEEARTSGKYTQIVAVGGDGTVNEVGSALCGSDIAFAVIWNRAEIGGGKKSLSAEYPSGNHQQYSGGESIFFHWFISRNVLCFPDCGLR